MKCTSDSRGHGGVQDKTTPLFAAAISGQVGIVRVLIEAGAGVNVESGNAAVPLAPSAMPCDSPSH
jgi:hypothetical protein